MPYAQSRYPFENKKQFESTFPADFIAESVDQTRGWYVLDFVCPSVCVSVSRWAREVHRIKHQAGGAAAMATGGGPRLYSVKLGEHQWPIVYKDSYWVHGTGEDPSI